MLLYRLIFALVLPFVILRLGVRVLRGREPRARLAERLGRGPAVAPGAIWLHAASNGELVSVRPLIAALRAARPDLRLVITTNTVTARDLAVGWNEPGVTACMAPLDGRAITRRFLDQVRPAALIVVENELWPNRLSLCAARAVPVFVVGARMSDRSSRRWRKTGLGTGLMRAITALSAQDTASEAAFLGLGLAPDRLLARVNLKTVVALPAPTESLGWDRTRTVLAASTHEGEDEIVLDAFVQARTKEPDLRLILAPRHPRRADAIARLIAQRGLDFTRRSENGPADRPVLLADTMGEMANWYAAAGICFVGGSLVRKGGHTPYEPVGYSCALTHGPSVENHAEAFAALDAAGAAVVVSDAPSLARAFLLTFSEQRKISAKAEAVARALSPRDAPEILARAIIVQSFANQT